MKKLLHFCLLFPCFFLFSCDSSNSEAKVKDIYLEEEENFAPPGEFAKLEKWLGKPLKKSHTHLVKDFIKEKKVLYYIDWSWEKIFEKPWDTIPSEKKKELENLQANLEEIFRKEVNKLGGKIDKKESKGEYITWEWFKTYSTSPKNIREFWIRANCVYRNSDGKIAINVFLRHLQWDKNN